MSADRNAGKRHDSDGLLLFVAALVCGVANWYLLRSEPFLAHPIIDAAEYLAESRAIVAGVSQPGAPSIHGPVYPLLLVPFLSLAGGVLGAVYLMQIVLHAFSVVLIRRCGLTLLGRAHGNIAGLLLAAAPPMLYFQVQVLPVVAQVFVHSLLIYLLVVRDPRRKKWTPLFAGMACGISWLIHPGGGLFFALLIPVLWTITRRAETVGLLLAGVVLTLLPFSVLRMAAGGSPLPVQGNTGLNLYIGNCAGADGTPRIRPGYGWERLLAAPERDGAGEGEENRWYIGRVIEEATTRPGKFLGRLATKGVLFLSGHPIDASQDFDYFRDRSFLLRNVLFDAPLVVALSLAFLIARWRRWGGGFRICAAALAGYWLAVALTVFSIRYRAPAWPFLALLASGIPFAWPSATGRLRAIATGAAAIVLVLSFLTDPFGYKIKNPVRTAYNLGRLYYTRGDFVRAEEWFGVARAERPDDPDVWNALGALATARGRGETAARCYGEALALAPDYADARFNLGLLLAGRGENADAKRELEEAIRLSPAHAAAHYTLGILREREGNSEGAEAAYREAVLHDPTRDDAFVALGVLLAKSGRRAEAEECFRRALVLNPASAAASANLAKLLAPGKIGPR